jgi:23S rRNA (cytidine1920-2'-O)/16S rRNA (cytidine1409-2'-O)-methyltransferase
MTRERLDVLVHRRGLAESRDRARRLILAGSVRVKGQRADKPGRLLDETVEIEVASGPRFVSRGGEKLDAALETFGIDVRGRVCLDVGASTGGFTDCLLQRGARRVFAVDVGKGQLHWRLRNDARVTVREALNARYLQPADLDAVPDVGTMDVSFISLTKVMPAVVAVLASPADLVTLIKPQFEAGREDVMRGGVVRDEAVRRRVVEELRRFGERSLGLTWRGVCVSPLKGPAGNVEFAACWRKS